MGNVTESVALTRRSFIKTATLAGAAVALSTRLSASLKSADKAWADEASETKMYVSTCHGCIQVCPCRVYVRDGVVVKLEGHPIAPANLGSMCLKGLSQLHTMYSPRRVLYPLRRTGARGAENVAWERISWDEAIELAGSKIAEAIEKYGTYSFFASTGGGGGYSSLEIPRTLATAFGSPNSLEPGCAQCYLPRVAIADLMYAGQNQSVADCSLQEFHKGLSPYEAAKGVTQDTKVLVVWGAQPSVSQVAQSGRGVADLRETGCKIVVVDPNMSPDAVKADVWLRVRPGADCALTLAWIKYVIDNKKIDEAFCKEWTNLPFIVDPDSKLPYYATDIWPDYVQSTPEDTPAYVCYDNRTNEVKPFEYASKDVDPEIFWKGEVNGKTCQTAGQYYVDACSPWTLEKAEEVCWIPAATIEEAIKIYADAPVAGIAHGVSSDMQQISSQLPLGLLGLDMMMGYVNKPGAALTQHTRPTWVNGAWGPALTPDNPAPRPVYRPNGSYFTLYDLGYEIGSSPAQNEARIAALPDATDKPKNKTSLWFMNQMFLDRLGMKNHKGLYHWMMSQIPSVLEAIKTGIPYKPRVWYECSGNKLAMLGNATSWYDMFPEIDFCITQYPNLTSFHAEVADLVFPLEEWLENPITLRNQLNYVFPEPQIVHIGETVSTYVPPLKTQNAAAKILNDYMAAGNEIVFGAIGAVAGTESPASPSQVNNSAGTELQTSINSTYLHEQDGRENYTLKFPIGAGVQGVWQEDSVILGEMAARYGAPDYETFINDVSYQQPDPTDPTDPRFVIDPKIFWQYDQHTWTATDGLPRGFGTESRKCEIYLSVLIKSAATGFPYCYPRPQVPVDPSIG
ncbi:MAG: molybdopterin-dependent oxidoreductase, partial [Coriobacteriales bacterium]|nr:molybdopterin-dependent oxidoreductase [Coriobacteriales bacterium]